MDLSHNCSQHGKRLKHVRSNLYNNQIAIPGDTLVHDAIQGASPWMPRSYNITTGVFRNTALGIYLVFRWKWEQSWHFYSGNKCEFFPNKRPWGAPTDGRCYGNSRYYSSYKSRFWKTNIWNIASQVTKSADFRPFVYSDTDATGDTLVHPISTGNICDK